MLIFAIIALKLQQINFNMIHVHSENIKMEILMETPLFLYDATDLLQSFFENKIYRISRKWRLNC